MFIPVLVGFVCLVVGVYCGIFLEKRVASDRAQMYEPYPPKILR